MRIVSLATDLTQNPFLILALPIAVVAFAIWKVAAASPDSVVKNRGDNVVSWSTPVERKAKWHPQSQ